MQRPSNSTPHSTHRKSPWCPLVPPPPSPNSLRGLLISQLKVSGSAVPSGPPPSFSEFSHNSAHSTSEKVNASAAPSVPSPIQNSLRFSHISHKHHTQRQCSSQGPAPSVKNPLRILHVSHQQKVTPVQRPAASLLFSPTLHIKNLTPVPRPGCISFCSEFFENFARFASKQVNASPPLFRIL